MKKQYTYDECYEIALQCKNKMDMHNKKYKAYKTAKDILNITNDSEDVINKSMFDYSNDKRKDNKEENVLIGKTRNIGKNMLRVVKGYSNYEKLYKDGAYKFATLDDIDYIVTEKEPEESIKEILNQKEVKVIC